jgi:phage terminase small subunit
MTLRQKRLAENIGNSRTLTEALLKSGYSESMAHQQSNVTKSKGWNEILERALPDKKLLKRHKELLDKHEFIAIGKVGEREVMRTGEIDANAVARGLEMAYKLKNKFPKEGGVNINEAKILVMPSELIKKYDIPPNANNSSE